MAGLLLVPLWLVAPLLTLLVLYWVIRLAVRHGVEDADRRRAERAREAAGWDPDRH